MSAKRPASRRSTIRASARAYGSARQTPQASMPSRAASSTTAWVSRVGSIGRILAEPRTLLVGSATASLPFARQGGLRMHDRVISRAHQSTMSALLTVVGAAVLTAFCAQMSFGYPVPTTLQTFAVLGSAAFLGARKGAAAQLLYIGAGAAGMPVFADGHGGIDWLTQANPLHASGGYLWGYPLAALLVGWLCDRYGRSFY